MLFCGNEGIVNHSSRVVNLLKGIVDTSLSGDVKYTLKYEENRAI